MWSDIHIGWIFLLKTAELISSLLYDLRWPDIWHSHPACTYRFHQPNASSPGCLLCIWVTVWMAQIERSWFKSSPQLQNAYACAGQGCFSRGRTQQAQPFSASQNIRSTAVSHQTLGQSLNGGTSTHAAPARPSHGDLNLQLLFLSCRIKG